MADPTIRIMVHAVTDAAERQMRKLQGTVEETGKSASKSGRLFDEFKSAVAGIGLVVGAAAGGFVALKKAWDFGKEGAAIAQTADSFNDLMSSMGVAPDILNQLRDASRGTVDDMTIMSSTMTLLAGTSDDLGRAIVGSAPQLMEIAKAAHKLNPELGDTAFLYESLATGIKRASPQILDNLGLVVKIGDVQQRFADKIGVAVEAMTAEQKQLALLEGALDAGNRLIEQVDGSTEEMADSFAYAEAQMKNATNRIKASLAPAIADVSTEVADAIPKIADTGNQIVTLAEAGMEWVGAAFKGEDATQAFRDSMMKAVTGFTEAEWSIKNSTLAVGELTAEYQRANVPVQELTAETGNMRDEIDRAVVAFGKGKIAAETLAEAEREAARASDEFKASMSILSEAMRGEYGDALTEYQSDLAALDQSFATGDITAGEYKSGLDELTVAFQENTNAIIYNVAEKQILDALEKGLIEDVNNSGTAYDEATAALWSNAEALGLVDEATRALMQSVQAQTDAFIGGTITADQLSGGLGGLAEAQAAAVAQGRDLKGVIDALHDKTITITTNYVQTGPPPAGQGTGGGRPGVGYQHGGQFVVRGPSGPDRVPVAFRATAGEVVTITPVGGAAPPSPVGGATKNYNLTINTSAQAESALSDFHTMRALAGV